MDFYKKSITFLKKNKTYTVLMWCTLILSYGFYAI